MHKHLRHVYKSYSLGMFEVSLNFLEGVKVVATQSILSDADYIISKYLIIDISLQLLSQKKINS